MRRRGAWSGIFGLALVAGLSTLPTLVSAAVGPPDNSLFNSQIPAVAPGTKMIVESTQIVYDYDHKTVAAVGNVHIFYGQYTLLADKVTYDEVSGRLVADGNVHLTDPTGNTYNSTHIDVTSNFRDAFVASLRVDTPDQTHFTAQSATRQGGDVISFNDASYTACEVCAEQPQKPPLWDVKAAKIVLNQKEHTVSFSQAKLEFLGFPIAQLPYFTMPDPSVKRLSGFLWPTGGFTDKLGFFVSTPYFWALAPSYDVTFTPTIYSKQGFLGDVQWRQRLANGQYSLEMAGIDQQDKGAFRTASPSYTDFRGGIRTQGDFAINPRWAFGWDGTLLSGRTFTRDYDVLSNENSELRSTIHLTGIGDRNYFEARASAYQILTDPSAPGLTDPARYDQGRQGYAVPVIDYNRIIDGAHGQVTMTSNFTSLARSEDDPLQAPFNNFYAGTAGSTTRASQQIAWQNQMIGANGAVVTPFAYVRADGYFLAGQTNAVLANTSLTADPTAFRAMPAAGIEWSYPVLIGGGGATQIIEPKVQFIARPNEMGIGQVPNNDAQSLVYEVANLFDWSKFSGYDRDEGGSRLNVGVHYNGSFGNGAAVDGTFGQSFQVLGQNSFAATDIADVGQFSGLQTAQSDYVGAVSLDTGLGPSFQLSGRFDDKTLSINRAEVEATAALGPVTASAAYYYLRQNPANVEVTGPSSVVHGAASVNISEYWRAFGSVAFDVAKSAVASNSLGIAFDNSCLTFAVSYNETRKNYTDIEPDRQLNFRLELRTLGTGSVSTNLNNL